MRAFSTIALMICFAMSDARADVVLWYNGDGRGPLTNATVNLESTNFGSANVYDDFVVDQPWIVNRIWSNNAMNVIGVTQASWSIRSGVSTGNGGTVVASGISAATQSLTGRAGNPYPTESRIEVSGLNVNLAPGRYWLSVSPNVGVSSTGILSSYLSATMKDNSIGSPNSTNGNSFLFWPAGGFNFENVGGLNLDYSMGVAGVVAVPEPSAGILFGAGVLAVAFVRWKRSLRIVR